MDRPHVAQLTHTNREGIDWQLAERSIKLVGEQSPGRPGYSPKVVVEMLPPKESLGLILLPDKVKGDMRADLGVVLKSCEGAPEPGSLVIVRPYDGAMFQDADMGAYKPKNRVAIYGVFAEFDYHPQTCNWYDSVVAEIRDEMIIPLGDKVHIEFDKAQAISPGGVYLPDQALNKTGMATVRAVGPMAEGLSVGDRICYDERLLLETGLQLDPMDGGNRDFGICDERAILYVLEEAVAA